MIENYRELEIWQLSRRFAVVLYKTSLEKPFTNDYALKDQIRRAAISIPSNIAEGFGRQNNNELIQFLRIAKGSCCEVQTQLIIAKEINYISVEVFDILNNQLEEIMAKIGKFISYLESKRKMKEFIKRTNIRLTV